jgi:transposase
VKARRDAWPEDLAALCGGDFARVSFLDESGAVTNLVRTHGRSECGARCVDAAPQGHWKVMTAVAAVRLDGLVAPFTIDCPVDGEVFGAYVEHVLVPTLRGGDVVVMDNLSAHKGPRIRRLIEAAGAAVLYLPPYSPDFNPIEMAISKVKAVLRKLARRTVEALFDSIGDALASITRDDARNYITHCGYAATV